MERMASEASSGTVTKWYGAGPRQVQSSPLNVSSRVSPSMSSATVPARLASADAGPSPNQAAGVPLRREVLAREVACRADDVERGQIRVTKARPGDLSRLDRHDSVERAVRPVDLDEGAALAQPPIRLEGERVHALGRRIDVVHRPPVQAPVDAVGAR